MPHLWVRSESRANERRVGLTPDGLRELQAQGFRITVEESPHRILPIAAFAEAGAEIAPEGAWPDAPADAIIFGLKELPETGSPLRHRHIMFGHAYKGQPAGRALLRRFRDGGGTLAYWNDTANLGAASTITAGTLTVTTPATPVPSWSIKHTSGATTPVANIAAVRIVPGDQLIYTVPANINAEGQNLRFQVGLAGGAITASSASAADTALATRLANSATFTVTGATPVGSPSANTFEHKSNTSSTYATTITATITWPFGAAGSEAQDNPAKAGVVDLSQFALSVTQVDGSITIP